MGERVNWMTSDVPRCVTCPGPVLIRKERRAATALWRLPGPKVSVVTPEAGGSISCCRNQQEVSVRVNTSTANKISAAAVVTALALATLVATYRDASAQQGMWCGYSGGSTECTYTSEAQCRQSHRDCLP